MLLIGLAVGVDYSMFYLGREREERAAGRSERAALEAAAATSGRSVLISGLTVIVAMAGMFVTGDKTFASFGVATMMVVAVAMLGSLTVLPALLSRLGDRVDRVRVRRRRRNDGEGRIWGSIVDRVLRRPALSAVIAGGAAARARAPGAPDPDGGPVAGHVPDVARGRQDVQADAAGVPRHGAAGERRRQGAERERPGGSRGDPRLEQRALASGRVHEPITIDVNKAGTVANITIPIDGNGTDKRVERLADAAPRSRSSRDGGRAAEHRGRRHRADRPVEGLGRPDPVGAAARGRVRARVRVRADAGRVPLDRDRGQGDPAQLPLGRGRLRDPRAGLPARLRQGPARLQLHRRDLPRDPAAAVRDPVRPLDGLPRLHRQPDPRDASTAARPWTRRSRTGSSPPPASSRAPRSSWSACSRSSRRCRCCSSSSSASGSRRRS